MKKLLVTLVSAAIMSSVACAATQASQEALPKLNSDVNIRGGYDLGNHQYLTKIEFAHTFNNGIFTRLETDANNGVNSLKGSTNNYSEIELGNLTPISELFGVKYGAKYHWDNAMSSLRPYIQAQYYATPNLVLAAQYTYDYSIDKADFNNPDKKGVQGRPSDNRVDIFAWYNINDTWKVSEDVTYYFYSSKNFDYVNQKSHKFENDLTLTYTASNQFNPYIEWAYNGDTANYKGQGNHTADNVVYVGTYINF